MRPYELAREIWALTWAQKTSTILVIVLVGAMCLTTLLTVGRSAAAEVQVAQRMESAGSRVVTVRDQGDEDVINPGSVAVISALSGVETAIGLGTARDVVNGAVGEVKVPARDLVGDLGSVVKLTRGRWPAPGEALVTSGARVKLGMEGPFGYVVDGGNEHAVVGEFEPLSVVEELDGGVVIAVSEGRADYLRVLATDSTAVEDVTDRAVQVLSPADMSKIQVESPATLAQVQAEVAGDLSKFSRGLLTGVLISGGTLVAVAVLADVLLRRSDLGRRRALGATRALVAVLVAGRVVVPAIIGALVGSLAGLAATQRIGAMPPLDFAAGTAVLAVIAALIAALPPALFAANRDPVSVLRTP